MAQLSKCLTFDLTSGLDLSMKAQVPCWAPHWTWNLLKNNNKHIIKYLKRNKTLRPVTENSKMCCQKETSTYSMFENWKIQYCQYKLNLSIPKLINAITIKIPTDFLQKLTSIY